MFLPLGGARVWPVRSFHNLKLTRDDTLSRTLSSLLDLLVFAPFFASLFTLSFSLFCLERLRSRQHLDLYFSSSSIEFWRI